MPRSCTHWLPRLSFALVLAAALPPVAMAATTPAAATPAAATLQQKLDALEQRARPGTFGIAVLDLQSGATWGVHADQAFPMMSVFKAPLAAAVLARVDAGSLSLDQKVTIDRRDVLEGSAVPSIGAHFHGERMRFSVRQLLVAAVSQSDNTAADALARLIGTASVTAYLRAHGIEGMHVDTDEAGIHRVFQQLGPDAAPPANETPAQRDLRWRRGYQAFLADPRNRSTPMAAADFLRKLWRGELLSPASTQQLIQWMDKPTVRTRLRGGLPPGVKLAEKTGSSGTLDGMTAAYNDIGILRWPDGHVVVIAAFISDSRAPQEQRDALFTDLTRVVARALHP